MFFRVFTNETWPKLTLRISSFSGLEQKGMAIVSEIDVEGSEGSEVW